MKLRKVNMKKMDQSKLADVTIEPIPPIVRIKQETNDGIREISIQESMLLSECANNSMRNEGNSERNVTGGLSKCDITSNKSCDEPDEPASNPWSPAKCVFCSQTLSSAYEPKLLECLHTACSACVNAKLQDQEQSDKDIIESSIECSYCHTLCNTQNIIDNHFILESEAAMASSINEVAAKARDVKCSSCSDNAAATSWCVDCAEFICDSCVKAHKRLKITKDHTIKAKEEAESEAQSSTSTFLKSLFCSVHPQEQLTLFCELCDKLTCRDCQLSEHRDHKYKFINEIATETRGNIAGLLGEVSYKRVLLKSAMKVIDDRQNMIIDKKKVLVKEITQMVVRLTNAINARGKQLVLSLNEVCDAKQKTLSEKKEALENLSLLTDHCIEFVSDALSKGSDMAILSSKKSLTAHLQRIKCRRADIPNPEIPVRICLSFEKVPELIRVISSIGTIIVDGRVYPSRSVDQTQSTHRQSPQQQQQQQQQQPQQQQKQQHPQQQQQQQQPQQQQKQQHPQQQQQQQHPQHQQQHQHPQQQQQQQQHQHPQHQQQHQHPQQQQQQQHQHPQQQQQQQQHPQQQQQQQQHQPQQQQSASSQNSIVKPVVKTNISSPPQIDDRSINTKTDFHLMRNISVLRNNQHPSFNTQQQGFNTQATISPQHQQPQISISPRPQHGPPPSLLPGSQSGHLGGSVATNQSLQQMGLPSNLAISMRHVSPSPQVTSSTHPGTDSNIRNLLAQPPNIQSVYGSGGHVYRVNVNVNSNINQIKNQQNFQQNQVGHSMNRVRQANIYNLQSQSFAQQIRNTMRNQPQAAASYSQSLQSSGPQWHIPQQQGLFHSARPAPASLPLDESFKIHIKTQSNSQNNPPCNGEARSGSFSSSVTSSVSKTPSPSTPREDPNIPMDKFCQDSVNDLMATIAKLDSNGIEVIPEINKQQVDSVVDSSTPGFCNSQASATKPSSEPVKEDANEDWCAVCMDGGELICCDNCPKVFHVNCHIPPLKSIPGESETWQCLLCTDVTNLTPPEGEMGKRKRGLSFSERKLAERVVLELYCQYETSLHFREVASSDETEYHDKVKKPMALDVVRGKLDPDDVTHYTSLQEVISDVRRIFKNAKLYYSKESQIYEDAKLLEEFFERLLTRWIPDYAFDQSESDEEVSSRKIRRFDTSQE